jgi:hypothetical protein
MLPKIFSLLLLFSVSLFSQDADSLQNAQPDTARMAMMDSLAKATTAVDSSLRGNLWPALWRSAIIPGWGQIEQEHPGRAVIFYALTLTCVYNMFYNQYWYDQNEDYYNKVKIRQYGLFLLQIYALNLADIIQSHYSGNDIPWPQEMYSDTPLKSPWGAVARSAMLPGWGQFYNESYIKSVLTSAAFFYFGIRALQYGEKYRETGNPAYKDQRVTNTWYLGLTYFLIMVDAYIDAYLFGFDDIINFSWQYLPQKKSFSLGVQIVF